MYQTLYYIGASGSGTTHIFIRLLHNNCNDEEHIAHRLLRPTVVSRNIDAGGGGLPTGRLCVGVLVCKVGTPRRKRLGAGRRDTRAPMIHPGDARRIDFLVSARRDCSTARVRERKKGKKSDRNNNSREKKHAANRYCILMIRIFTYISHYNMQYVYS